MSKIEDKVKTWTIIISFAFFVIGIICGIYKSCINCPRQWGSGGTITTTNIE